MCPQEPGAAQLRVVATRALITALAESEAVARLLELLPHVNDEEIGGIILDHLSSVDIRSEEEARRLQVT